MSEANNNLITASQVDGGGAPVPPPPPVPPVPPPPPPPVPPLGAGNINGLVFNDENLNGIFDPGETTVADVTVILDDINSAGDVGTVSDLSGSYSFTGVLPGVYTMRVTAELPQTQTNASPIIVITSDPTDPANNVIVNLGTATPQDVGNVTGIKFFDVNGNGLFDEGEPGIPNFTIYADINSNGILDIGEPFTVTDNTGSYFLPNLPATRLAIREVQAPGVSQTSNPSPTVDVQAGETFVGANFGNTPLVVILGEIGGTVFNDLNANNLAEPGEPPLAGATIYLDSNGNNLLEPGERSEVTGSDGRYSFPGLPINSYVVRELPPPGFINNIPDPIVTLTVDNTFNDTINFANVLAPPPPPGLVPPPGPVPAPAPVTAPVSVPPAAAVPVPVPAESEAEPEPPSEATATTNGETTNGEATATTNGETTNGEATATTNGETNADSTENVEASRIASQVTGVGDIAGVVFQDFNANQLVDPEEPGAPNITVYLDVNNNGVLDEGEATFISDATGQYSFTGLPEGNYVVKVDGVIPTTPDPVITLVGGDNANFVNIGVPGVAPPPTPPGPVPPGPVPPPGPEPVPPPGPVPPPPGIPDPLLIEPGVIVGAKFNDVNGNSFLDADDFVRPGIPIYLDLNDNSQLDPGEPNTETDVNGQYRFDGLPASIYRVREIIQPGEIQTSVGPLVTLVPGQTVVYNFTNTTIFGQDPFSSSISGVVFDDGNGNDVLDPGEGRFPGIQIYVDLNGNDELDIDEPFTLTDENGEYIFRAIPPGTYFIRQNLIAGQQSQIEQVTPNPEPVTTIVPNDNPSGINFGNNLVSLPGDTISGIVFNDINGNQLYEPFLGETGIPGVEVFLDWNNDGKPQGFEPNQISAGDGSYGLDVAGFGVPDGSYNLRAFVRTGFFQTTSTVAIDYAGGESFIYNFGLAPQGIIGGVVFDDFNGDGFQDPSEPLGIADVQLYVDLNNNNILDPEEPNTFSNINGNYAIVGLNTPGTYTIRQVPRADLVKTTPDTVIELGLNQNFTFNIGNSPTVGTTPTPPPGNVASIAGTKFQDTNSNQLVDPDEPGLPGFTIYLDLNENGVLDDGEPNSVTDATGQYSFVNLPILRDDAGNLLPYIVREVQQPGFTQTTPDAVISLVEGESANFVNIGNAPGAPPPPPPPVDGGATEQIAASSLDPLIDGGSLGVEELRTISSIELLDSSSGILDEVDNSDDFGTEIIAIASSSEGI